jgi:transcriptional regulator with XRE-family HTH domain
MGNRERDAVHAVAVNLRLFMLEKGFSESALAKASQVSQRTINNYLREKHDPQLTNLLKLADTLGVELWELLREMTPWEREIYRAMEKNAKEVVRAGQEILNSLVSVPHEAVSVQRQAELRRDELRAARARAGEPTRPDPSPRNDPSRQRPRKRPSDRL